MDSPRSFKRPEDKKKKIKSQLLFRDVKLNELEKVINQYQEKLNDVTQSYQQKIGILENKIIDKELEKGYTM